MFVKVVRHSDLIVIVNETQHYRASKFDSFSLRRNTFDEYISSREEGCQRAAFRA